ncbi:hypothetical protein [Azospirillum halopraeferens]|uniref:hypothetical protein n=1 Tax=Azospirillum halopraeferens TaxID=34010 RepID=UPI00049105F6|nr:hypothetical protein [Azospirillum halopraeferens]
MHNKHEPSLEDVLGNLRSLLEAEREVAADCRPAAPYAMGGDLNHQLIRLERLLADVLAGQADLRRRLHAIEQGRTDASRLEDLVLRLIARLPLAGLDTVATPAVEAVN